MRYAIAEKKAVKGRVKTNLDQLGNGPSIVLTQPFEVRQVIDGYTTYVEQFDSLYTARLQFDHLARTARRQLHAYESDTKAEVDDIN